MPVTRSGAKRDTTSTSSEVAEKKAKKTLKKSEKTQEKPPKGKAKQAQESVDPEDNEKDTPNEEQVAEKPGKGKGKKAKETKEQEAEEEITATSIYEFTANDIKGEPVNLDKYKGHVCIIVNVASKCGHTKSNYEQLVKLDEDLKESKGLRILAFPCNQFGSQEPGDSEKICKFVEGKNVKFDVFEKINVNGPEAHPLWKYLKGKIAGKEGHNIKWNFTKFIVNKEGEVVERFASAIKPNTLVPTLEKYF